MQPCTFGLHGGKAPLRQDLSHRGAGESGVVSLGLKKECLPKTDKLHTYLAVKCNSVSVLKLHFDKIYLARIYQNWVVISLCVKTGAVGYPIVRLVKHHTCIIYHALYLF